MFSLLQNGIQSTLKYSPLSYTVQCFLECLKTKCHITFLPKLLWSYNHNPLLIWGHSLRSHSFTEGWLSSTETTPSLWQTGYPNAPLGFIQDCYLKVVLLYSTTPPAMLMENQGKKCKVRHHAEKCSELFNI